MVNLRFAFHYLLQNNDQISSVLQSAFVRKSDSTLEKRSGKKTLAKFEKQVITLKLNYVIFGHDRTMRKLRTLRLEQSNEFHSTMLMITMQSDHVQV